MTPTVGDTLTLEVTKVVHGGWGLARHEGFVVFVSGVLPGERVAADIREVKKSHAFADVIDVHEASPHRVPHIWPEAEWTRPPRQRPGGADYGHIALEHQRVLKAEIIRGELAHHTPDAGHIAAHVIVAGVPGSSDGRHWRTRETLHVGPDGTAGPRGLKSHEVIAVDSLPLAVSAIEGLGAHRQNWSGHSTLRLVAPSGSEPRLVIDRQAPQEIVEKVGSRSFRLSDQTFWQVHQSAAETLHDAVGRAIRLESVRPSATHLDLYGGVGLFAATLADTLGPDQAVVSVESDERASSYAGVNLTEFSGARAEQADTLTWLRRHTAQQSQQESPTSGGVVVVDPPRVGAGAEVVDLVAALRPSQIVYVACDPVALARDAARLAGRGYELAHLEAFDLFPHTHHVECVARFESKG